MVIKFAHKKIAWMTGLQMAIAVTVVFILDHYFSLRQGYWAAITVAVVMQPAFSSTVIKGLMRIIGTIVGAAMGWGIAHFVSYSLPLVLLFLFIAILITGYLSLIPTILSYVGLIAGVTLIIVVALSMDSGLLIEVAKYRSLEVILGVIIATLTALLFMAIIRPKKNTQPVIKIAINNLSKQKWLSRTLLIKALMIALAVTLTFLPWSIWRYSGGFWAPISCLFVMEENLHGTCKKAGARFIAHFLAALYGLFSYMILLALPWQNSWFLLPPLIIGFFICGIIIGDFYDNPHYKTLGNTMGVAITIMLLFGANITPSLHTIFARFVNIMIGIISGIILSSLA